MFTPIKGSAGYDSRRRIASDIRILNQTDKAEITKLLVGRKVTKADDNHIVLDNGITIKAIGRDGGCNCNSGCYDLSVLNSVDNIITSVEFDYQPGAEDYTSPSQGWYRIFVFADNEKINLMQFDGTDGNGYYGTGFEILVRDPR